MHALRASHCGKHSCFLMACQWISYTISADSCRRAPSTDQPRTRSSSSADAVTSHLACHMLLSQAVTTLLAQQTAICHCNSTASYSPTIGVRPKSQLLHAGSSDRRQAASYCSSRGLCICRAGRVNERDDSNSSTSAFAGHCTASHQAVLTAAGEDEEQFTVLRLTLGIPGFDEAQLPRVVAALCMTLILVNHTASSGEITAGQVCATTWSSSHILQSCSIEKRQYVPCSSPGTSLHTQCRCRGSATSC